MDDTTNVVQQPTEAELDEMTADQLAAYRADASQRLTEAEAEQLVNPNEPAPAAVPLAKAGDTIAQGATLEEAAANLQAAQEAYAAAGGEPQIDQGELDRQLQINTVVENVVEAVHQLQMLVKQNLPQVRQASLALTKFDEASLWLLTMYDADAEAHRPAPFVPTAEPGETAGIWLPPEAGEVTVPQLHVVEGGGNNEPAGNGTEAS
jgi:predicted RNase H-like HicB family nuclease